MAGAQAAKKGGQALLNNVTMEGRRNIVFAVVAGWAVAIKAGTAIFGGSSEEKKN
eukprot:m.7034 g.7034  ORF g.7034 m.7034 type:complete len:55 (+) comp5212_c0_seq1:196-360(+)